jgi:hypothetical protein
VDPHKAPLAVAYVLPAGYQSMTLPKAKFESACSPHKYFPEGTKNGVLVRLPLKGLAAYYGEERVT